MLVRSLTKSAQKGVVIPSPDGKRYLQNYEDAAGIQQVYVGLTGKTPTCISNVQRQGGPTATKRKMQAQWHPSGKFITMAVEREWYNTGFLWLAGQDAIEGILQCGIWCDLWACTPDGLKWTKLVDSSGWFGAGDGLVGPAFTPNGKQCVFSRSMGDVFTYKPFGRWELMLADWVEWFGVPILANLRNITPAGMNWNEPGNFHPDGERVLLSGSPNNANQEGQDQYLLNIKTGALVDLTPSPFWDEHGLFSPDGSKIVWMSSLPYASDPDAHTTLGIKTEFMLMEDVAHPERVQQLTRFRQRGSPEYHNGIAAVPIWAKDGKSLQLTTLEFPNYHIWDLVFA